MRLRRADDADIDYSFVGSAVGDALRVGTPTVTDEAIGHRYVPNMSRENYRQMVEACKTAIYDGEIIQVVVSQRLTRRTAAEPFDLYRSLRAINPSPYMFYLDLGRFSDHRGFTGVAGAVCGWSRWRCIRLRGRGREVGRRRRMRRWLDELLVRREGGRGACDASRSGAE